MPKHMHFNGCVRHTNRSGYIENAEVQLIRTEGDGENHVIHPCRTNAAGLFDFAIDCQEGRHVLRCKAFGKSCEHAFNIDLSNSVDEVSLDLDLDLGFRLTIHNHANQEERLVPASYAKVGLTVLVRAETKVDSQIGSYQWKEHRDAQMTPLGRDSAWIFGRPGNPVIEVTIVEKENGAHEKAARASAFIEFAVSRVRRTKNRRPYQRYDGPHAI